MDAGPAVLGLSAFGHLPVILLRRSRVSAMVRMLPYVILHNAVSVDGRIDWVSIDIGLYYSLIPTWKEDATLCGSETMMQPDPCEWENDGATDPSLPLLVVVDGRGRFKTWEKIVPSMYWRAGVALCSASTPEEHLDYLRKAGVDIITAGEDKVDVRAALEELNERYGVKTVRVDSGGTLNGVLLREGLVDEVSVVVHPQLVGGTSPRSMFKAPDLGSEEGVIDLDLKSSRKLKGGAVWLRYAVRK